MAKKAKKRITVKAAAAKRKATTRKACPPCPPCAKAKATTKRSKRKCTSPACKAFSACATTCNARVPRGTPIKDPGNGVTRGSIVGPCLKKCMAAR